MSCSLGEDDICVGCGEKYGGGCEGDDGFTDNDRHDFYDKFYNQENLTVDLAIMLRNMMDIMLEEGVKDLTYNDDWIRAKYAIEVLTQRGLIEKSPTAQGKIKYTICEYMHTPPSSSHKPVIDALREVKADFERTVPDRGMWGYNTKSPREIFQDNHRYRITIEEL